MQTVAVGESGLAYLIHAGGYDHLLQFLAAVERVVERCGTLGDGYGSCAAAGAVEQMCAVLRIDYAVDALINRVGIINKNVGHAVVVP